jgi:ribonuclease BN (tRNA processing enzyme)
MLNTYLSITLLLLFTCLPAQAQTGCGEQGVWLQVLGSGGPELDDGRASSGYVIWHDGKARFLVDMGGGSLLRFEQSGASLNDLDAILLSHFHADHSNDLPALIKASYLMPSATAFVQGLFGPGGVYRYLDDYLDGTESYRLLAHDVETTGKAAQLVPADARYRLTAVPVHHGPVPALAWRVELAGKTLVFSGDMNNGNDTLSALARDADLLVAHHAIPEEARGVARNLHMPPSVIGQIAARAQVKQLVLSHRMKRNLGREPASSAQIRHAYSGPLQFADDLQCFRP